MVTWFIISSWVGWETNLFQVPICGVFVAMYQDIYAEYPKPFQAQVVIQVIHWGLALSRWHRKARHQTTMVQPTDGKSALTCYLMLYYECLICTELHSNIIRCFSAVCHKTHPDLKAELTNEKVVEPMGTNDFQYLLRRLLVECWGIFLDKAYSEGICIFVLFIRVCHYGAYCQIMDEPINRDWQAQFTKILMA